MREENWRMLTMTQINCIRKMFFEKGMNYAEISRATGFDWSRQEDSNPQQADYDSALRFNPAGSGDALPLRYRCKSNQLLCIKWIIWIIFIIFHYEIAVQWLYFIKKT
jgi:hypothetical protein